MEVVTGSNGGRLNPWAEPFVPGSWCRPAPVQAAAAEVEDFSPEWWRLVASSPSFRDSWLRDYGDLGLLDADEGPDDSDAFFPPPRHNGADGEERKGEAAVKKSGGEVAPWGIEKWWRAHVASPPEVPKYAEKAPAKVLGGGRFSPRTIQQPR
ncbi:protein EARLY RESPONSIVE TO DEHYDRATION 15-like isoform X1 [Triticum urartu]|uniref:protein EARLY RESPONSIVE TO DEHYDRATION 15-like isoform X1 n=1 Tax=Triticum urartu TaxID=4572 RepID=UPI002043CE4B|nr:protein EARLY RESPONSIVE TO DEHYDRATION 15-like isoform X1 [Triticum urartu]